MATTQPTALFGIAALSLFVLAGGGCATTTTTQEIVTDRNGRTVYKYDEDDPGARESACWSGCTNQWPPVPPSSVEGEEFGSFPRRDGVSQVTYDGWPLYYYAGDNEPRDRKGDGIGGVWHVIPK